MLRDPLRGSVNFNQCRSGEEIRNDKTNLERPGRIRLVIAMACRFETLMVGSGQEPVQRRKHTCRFPKVAISDDIKRSLCTGHRDIY